MEFKDAEGVRGRKNVFNNAERLRSVKVVKGEREDVQLFLLILLRLDWIGADRE